MLRSISTHRKSYRFECDEWRRGVRQTLIPNHRHFVRSFRARRSSLRASFRQFSATTQSKICGLKLSPMIRMQLYRQLRTFAFRSLLDQPVRHFAKWITRVWNAQSNVALRSVQVNLASREAQHLLSAALNNHAGRIAIHSGLVPMISASASMSC